MMAELEPRPALKWFAQQMEAKLRACDYKGGWDALSFGQLFSMLRDEARELWDVIFYTGFEPEIIEEAADVANFCMMIADIARARMNEREAREGKRDDC
jgi:hypothetical protein